MERRYECNGTGSHDACCNWKYGETVAVQQTLSEMEFERGIWYAAQNNDIERVRSLLKKGISVDIQDGAGYTALHYGSRGGHWELCKLLVINGANVNAVTRCGSATPLHRAAMRGMSSIVEFLLKSGANPNLQDSDGYTALHRAILGNSAPTCRLLVPVTDLSIVDKKSRDPRRLAADTKDNYEILDLFRDFGKI